MLLTFDRFVAVTKPFHYPTLCNAKRARINATLAFLLSVVLNCPHARYAKVACCKTCIGIGSDKIGATYFAFISIVINGFIPYSVLIMLNTNIVYTVRRKKRIPAARHQQPIESTKGRSLE